MVFFEVKLTADFTRAIEDISNCEVLVQTLLFLSDMTRYLFIRLFSSLPALFIGLIGLFIFRLLPPQSVWEERIELLAIENGGYSEAQIQKEKGRIRQQLGLDLPTFYFSVQSAALPAYWPEGFTDSQKYWVKRLCFHSGLTVEPIELAIALQQMDFKAWENSDVSQAIEDANHWLNQVDSGSKTVDFRSLISQVKASGNKWKVFFPALIWHGPHNQFHVWFSQLLKGDLGVSWKNKEKVGAVIARAISNTVIFTLPALLLIFSAAYWFNIRLSNASPKCKAVIDQVLYLFDLIPLFGWALLFMVVFASGTVFSWFPSHVSASTLNGYTFWSRWIWPYVLPVAVLWLSTMPYITKHIDNAFQKSGDLPFVFMARARGLNKHTVNKSYRLRYALLPAITLFGEYLLAVVSGALVVEVLFSIQGVGKLLTDSVNAQDYPVVTGVVLFLILVRMISYLATDLLYYWMDPRIRLLQR